MNMSRLAMIPPEEPTANGPPSATPLTHLLDVDDLADDELERLFARAAALRTIGRGALPQTLHGHTVATLFFESSTRTRLSFELAAQRLGALPLLFDVGRSSLDKSETLYDTLQNLAAMGATMAVVRHRSNAVFTELVQRSKLSLINAGNGTEAHPTQALLDAFTLRRHLGTLAGRTVVITGDIRHSRVARSNIRLLRRLGARVLLCGPAQLLLDPSAALPLAEAVAQADAVMCLRIQHERHEGEGARAGESADSYLETYGLTEARFAGARPGCLILHPGPVNRDIELASSLVEHPQSLILEQVTNGVFMRMAVMEWIAGVLP